MHQQGVYCEFSNENSWIILSPIEQSIKRKMEAIGTPLKDWDIQINYGIKTGFNDAFIITTEKRDEILANCQTEEERIRTDELIRPILRGRDIKRYGYDWAKLYLIATFPSRHYDIEQYPAVKQHLLSFGKERLEQTGKTYSVNGEKVKARKKTNNKWFETQDSISYWDGYLQQIQEDYDYYPGDHEDGDEEDGNVSIDPGVSSGRMGRASDRSILQLNWQNGNLMSTEGEFSDESYMSYAYTEYPNVTPYFDFNVVVRPLFGSHAYEYDDMVSMLYMLRMMGKGSKNLVTKDVVDWGYRMPEPGEPEVIHEDTWAPFAYSFTEDNYLDVITGKCTLYSYQEDEHGNHVSESTSYYNDEYRFVYE